MRGALAGIRIKFRPYQMGHVMGVHFEHIDILAPVTYAVDLLIESDHTEAGDYKDDAWYKTHRSHRQPRLDALVPTSYAQQPQQARTRRYVNVSDITLSYIRGELGDVPANVCGEGKICPRAVGRFQCTSGYPCTGVAIKHFNVTGFSASSAYPEACSWIHVTGSGFDVHPSECVPPGV